MSRGTPDKKVVMEAETGENSSEELSGATINATLVQLQQMLSLLDLPLSRGQPLKQQPSMNEGLLYSLRELLIPLDTPLPMQHENSKSIAAVMSGNGNTVNAPNELLQTYSQRVTSLFQMADQLVSLAREPLSAAPNKTTALKVAEQISDKVRRSAVDEQNILLRMRKKRRLVSQVTTDAQTTSEETKNTKESIHSPLHPLPTTLVFHALSSWLSDALSFITNMSPASAVDALIAAYNAALKEQCENETATLSNDTDTLAGRQNRVRARCASWNEGIGGVIQVELRDVGVVTIRLQEADQKVRVAGISFYAPCECLDAVCSYFHRV